MKIAKHLFVLAVLPAFAMPAVAQPGYDRQQGNYSDNNNAGMSISDRIDRLEMRLQAGIRSGAISRREAMPLRQQLRQLHQLERRYAPGGINGRERSDLQRHMRDVRMAIRQADGNDQARWADYDRDDGYGRDGGWSDRRDDNWGDRRDDRYAAPQQQPSIAERVIDSVLGGGGLRVGQRASGNLYGLRGGDQSRFRDTDATYYRTDGRYVYEIDARNQTVLRVHPAER
jgi:hypothetical protein